MNCPKCSRKLEPAALNKDHHWCSVCAIEFDETGARLTDVSAFLAAPTPKKHSVKLIDAKKEGIEIPMDNPAEPEALAPSPPISLDPDRSFTITIGDVRFVARGKFDLFVGKTKVSIK